MTTAPEDKPARRARQHFEALYEGAPPWETGRPQPAIIELAATGLIRGDVLDIGCGTGENTLYLNAQGYRVTGVDVAANAIARAQAKAAARALSVDFSVMDARDLAQLGRNFDTALDSGLFHVFADHDRPRFAAAAAAILRPGGLLLILCFSEHEPGVWGPRRVTQAEIRATFGQGWHMRDIRPTLYEIVGHEPGVKAWLAIVERLG